MSEIVISVENLSKYYRLGVIGTGTFYGDVKRWWAKQRGRPDPYLRIGENDHGNRVGETIWALKDIDFSVHQGEALGIIGRNGAGKSTLLKILSQVTAPTKGEIKVKGRIASLLEVGTGFHPELTGRENIFLNGAIMGMNRLDVTRKFDEIVEFSGVEQFIDTPVKRYSSGMYVRLAFAVAAHLEPEILVVDEVLAVGDIAFQKKCLGKMSDVTREGRTVLFVSHNMDAIQRLVDRCILLVTGQIAQEGSSRAVIDAYMSAGETQNGVIKFPDEPNLLAQILRVALVDREARPVTAIDHTEDIRLEIEFIIRNPKVGRLDVAGLISLVEGTPIYSFKLNDLLNLKEKLSAGRYLLKISFPTNILNSGRYVARVCIALGHKAYHNHPNTGEGIDFEIIQASGAGLSFEQYTIETCILSTRPTYELDSCS